MIQNQSKRKITFDTIRHSIENRFNGLTYGGVTHLTISRTSVKQYVKEGAVCELSQATYTSQRNGVKSSTEKKKHIKTTTLLTLSITSSFQ